MLRVKVESSVDIFRAFLRRLFLSFCVLLLIQTERTIHYKSLFYNERHSFRGSRVKAHTEEKVYFPFFLLFVCIKEWGGRRRKFEWDEKLYRKSSHCQPPPSQD